MHRFLQNVKWDQGIAARVGQTCTGVGVSMARYNNFVAIIGCASGGLANDGDYGTYICYLSESTDGAANWAVVATATAASSTDTAYGTSFEWNAQKMADSKKFLRVNATAATGTGNVINVDYFRFNSRYPQATLST